VEDIKEKISSEYAFGKDGVSCKRKKTPRKGGNQREKGKM